MIVTRDYGNGNYTVEPVSDCATGKAHRRYFQLFKYKSSAIDYAVREVETVIARANGVHTRLESLGKLGGNNGH